MKKVLIIFLTLTFLLVACQAPGETTPEPVSIEPEPPVQAAPEPTPPVVETPPPNTEITPVQQPAVKPVKLTTKGVGDTCGGFGSQTCTKGLYCVYEGRTTTPQKSGVMGECVASLPKEALPPVKEAQNLVRATHEYKLEKGFNFIGISLMTGMTAGDLFKAAQCSPAEVHGNVLGVERQGFSLSDRITYVKGSAPDVFMIEAGQGYVIKCGTSGTLTLSGDVVHHYNLVQNTNFVVAPNALNGNQLAERLTCSPSVIYNNIVETGEEKIRSKNGDEFRPLAHNGERYKIDANSVLMLKCTRTGEVTFP